jgi:hypothetical protein
MPECQVRQKVHEYDTLVLHKCRCSSLWNMSDCEQQGKKESKRGKKGLKQGR